LYWTSSFPSYRVQLTLSPAYLWIPKWVLW
jgi:hypothetical protein